MNYKQSQQSQQKQEEYTKDIIENIYSLLKNFNFYKDIELINSITKNIKYQIKTNLDEDVLIETPELFNAFYDLSYSYFNYYKTPLLQETINEIIKELIDKFNSFLDTTSFFYSFIGTKYNHINITIINYILDSTNIDIRLLGFPDYDLLCYIYLDTITKEEVNYYSEKEVMKYLYQILPDKQFLLFNPEVRFVLEKYAKKLSFSELELFLSSMKLKKL